MERIGALGVLALVFAAALTPISLAQAQTNAEAFELQLRWCGGEADDRLRTELARRLALEWASSSESPRRIALTGECGSPRLRLEVRGVGAADEGLRTVDIPLHDVAPQERARVVALAIVANLRIAPSVAPADLEAEAAGTESENDRVAELLADPEEDTGAHPTMLESRGTGSGQERVRFGVSLDGRLLFMPVTWTAGGRIFVEYSWLRLALSGSGGTLAHRLGAIDYALILAEVEAEVARLAIDPRRVDLGLRMRLTGGYAHLVGRTDRPEIDASSAHDYWLGVAAVGQLRVYVSDEVAYELELALGGSIGAQGSAGDETVAGLSGGFLRLGTGFRFL